jgi:glucokinase
MDEVVGAIDIGGTKIAATVAGAGGPLQRLTVPTPLTGPIRTLPECAMKLLEDVCISAGIDPRSVRSVGVSSCGPFLKTDGMIGMAAPNICGANGRSADLPNDWDVVPLEAVLRERYGRVEIENDCVAALIAERTFGALQGEDHCAYVTWSTGIGFGLCVDGRVLQGKHRNAGHAGHMLLDETQNAECGCGNRGDLEALVAGRNLGNRIGKPTAVIFAAARQGEPWAQQIVKDVARWFGRALYNLTAALDLQAFAIGGSVWFNNADLLQPLVQQEIDSHFPALTHGVNVRTAGLGALVGDLAGLSLVIPPAWADAWRASPPWRKMEPASA